MSGHEKISDSDITAVIDLTVPAQNEVLNATMIQVVGNKTDTTAGTSVVSLVKTGTANNQTFHTVPGADSVANSALRDVVGNKTDTVSGTSAISLLKQIRTTTNTDDVSGTYTYTDGGGEQTVYEYAVTTRKIIYGIWLDLTTITKNGTIKLYYKIDGSNYREIESYAFTVATDSDGVFLSVNCGITNPFKITYTEETDEGAARDIVYSFITGLVE